MGQDLTGLTVLDAFAGSGLLGFEAWSRGARVTMIERNGRAHAALNRSAATLGAEVEVRRGDTLKLVTTLGAFDIVLVDPPYAAPVEPILAALECAVQGRLFLEADARTEVPAAVGRLALERSRNYGGTAIHHYRAEA